MVMVLEDICQDAQEFNKLNLILLNNIFTELLSDLIVKDHVSTYLNLLFSFLCSGLKVEALI